jgi:hypothetical protein
MKSILSRLTLGMDFFGSDSRNTPEFNKFFLDFKKELKLELAKIGATEFELKKNHFDCSGFFRAIDGQLYYISLSDVRHFFNEPTLLIRTAKHNKDWFGGSNNYINIEKDMFLKFRLPKS